MVNLTGRDRNKRIVEVTVGMAPGEEREFEDIYRVLTYHSVDICFLCSVHLKPWHYLVFTVPQYLSINIPSFVLLLIISLLLLPPILSSPYHTAAPS